MRSCIVASYLALAALLAPALARGDAAQPAAADPEALYRQRDDPASARQAERIWTKRLAADPADAASAIALGRIRYWLGTNGPGTPDEKKAVLERGVAAGRAAAAAAPARPDGHFWMAANMGALADAHGLRQGIKYRGAIRQALETARRLDPAFLDGSPDRALGRWYYKVPRMFGGDLAQSETHLRAALAYKTDSVITLIFLADTLLARDRRAEARAALEAALAAPLDPDWTPEDRRFKTLAQQMLASITRDGR